MFRGLHVVHADEKLHLTRGHRGLPRRFSIDFVKLGKILQDQDHAKAIARVDRQLGNDRLHFAELAKLVDHHQDLVWLVRAWRGSHQHIMDLLNQEFDDGPEHVELRHRAADEESRRVLAKLRDIEIGRRRSGCNEIIGPGVESRRQVEVGRVSRFLFQRNELVEPVHDPRRQIFFLVIADIRQHPEKIHAGRKKHRDGAQMTLPLIAW